MTTPNPNDLTRRPVGMIVWWGLPLAVGASASILKVPFRAGAAIWAVAFAWMATGCLFNAMRCHRVHCYISGPMFLIGAILAGLDAAGVVDLTPRTFTNAVSAVLVLAVLSFAPEMVWKRYA